ncbi:MAG: modulator protein [Rickettsiales bacterium]|nr:modulator protein [Rickettsiales bacterium]
MDKNFIFKIIEKLKKKGCDQSDVFLTKNFSISSSRRLGKLEKNEQSESYDLGIRAIVGKKQSIISSNNVNLKNIESLISNLYERVLVVPDNPNCGLLESTKVSSFDKKKFDSLDLYDSKYPNINELAEKAKILEDSALKNPLITNSEGAEVSWSRSNFFLGASNGMYQEFKKTNSSYILAVLASKDFSMERDYDYRSSVYLNDLGDLAKIGTETANRAVSKLNSRKIKTCKTSVIFDAKVAPSLISNLSSAANSRIISRGTSFLKDKLNKTIFGKKINIIDNPMIKRQTKSKIVDSEGNECSNKKLIENGTLKFFFNSLEYARQLNQKASGHASRSPSSLPYPSPTNLYLEKGDISKEKLIKELNNGLLITELMGSSINYSNGDYSRGANGFWIENGEITYPVSEITIAGNLIDMYANLTPANDLEFKFGINSPSCLIEKMTVAGI